MKIDQYYRRVFNENDICEELYCNPEIDISKYNLEDNQLYNKAVTINYSDIGKLQQLPEIDVSPDEWHRQNQQSWIMPDKYQQFDIAEWVLLQCNNEAEIQRAGAELIIYAERNLLDMLCYLKYLVDIMQENNIVWGVGRGSSVASFVLYKIGVHRINSLYYDLNFDEFGQVSASIANAEIIGFSQDYQLQFNRATSVESIINGAVLSGITITSLEADGSLSNNITVLYSDCNASESVDGIPSGELRGLLDLRDTELPKLTDQLDNFVFTYANEFNSIHNTK